MSSRTHTVPTWRPPNPPPAAVSTLYGSTLKQDTGHVLRRAACMRRRTSPVWFSPLSTTWSNALFHIHPCPPPFYAGVEICPAYAHSLASSTHVSHIHPPSLPAAHRCPASRGHVGLSHLYITECAARSQRAPFRYTVHPPPFPDSPTPSAASAITRALCVAFDLPGGPRSMDPAPVATRMSRHVLR